MAMLALKYWYFILLALIKAGINFSFFGGVQTAVTCSFSFPSSPLCVKPTPHYSGAWSTHTCADVTQAGCLWADVGAQTRAISEGQMGPSQCGCLVAQSTMAPVQTSCTTTTNRTPACVCVRGARVFAWINYLMPDISDATVDQGVSMSFLRILPLIHIHLLWNKSGMVEPDVTRLAAVHSVYCLLRQSGGCKSLT